MHVHLGLLLGGQQSGTVCDMGGKQRNANTPFSVCQLVGMASTDYSCLDD